MMEVKTRILLTNEIERDNLYSRFSLFVINDNTYNIKWCIHEDIDWKLGQIITDKIYETSIDWDIGLIVGRKIIYEIS